VVTDTSRPEGGDWLEGFLFDRRIAVLRGSLDDQLATRVATELMTLDATGDGPISLQVDCAGGTLTAALTLVDVIDVLGVPVHALCMGRVEGAAVAVVASCANRRSLPHTQFRMCDPEVSFSARASQAAQLARSQLDLLERYHKVLSRATHNSFEEIEAWCGSGARFDAPEAMRRNLIDEISHGKAGLRRVR
jgi:ATP-dependent Clp protease protease subunit